MTYYSNLYCIDGIDNFLYKVNFASIMKVILMNSVLRLIK